MIRIKLFTEEEWVSQLGGGPEKEPKQWIAQVECFRYLLRCCLDEEAERPPFRDDESRRLLNGEGLTFVSEEDWYSVYGEGPLGRERDSISNIPKWLKFALVAIHYSRQGTYTWMDFTCVPYERAWCLLSDMPFDILAAVKVPDIKAVASIFHSFSVFPPCKIINYPYESQLIEVTVTETESIIKSQYLGTALPKSFVPGTGYGLSTDKEGNYYSFLIGIEYAFQYYWKNDIPGIIQYIEKNYPEKVRLGEIHEIYNTFTLAEALGCSGESVVRLRYWDCKSCREHALENGRISSQEYEAFLAQAQREEDYKDYVYFRDTFQFISHLAAVPEVTFRKLPVMMVDKNHNGSYRIHGTLTVKYPELQECICDVVEERSPYRERYILVVDVEELLDSVRDIDRAAYGFRLLSDSLEIFDRYDAVRMFGRMLKEAYTSGACVIDEEFY